MSTVSPAQIKLIHTLKSRAKIADDDYRGMLHVVAGVSSSRDLSAAAATRIIDRLKGLQTGSQARRPASKTVTGPYAGKLRALWLSAWNLGAVRSNDDAALLAFVERQTGLPHTRFLTAPADAARAIEALKAICARHGVVWPTNRADVIGAKEAVITAQQRLLKVDDLTIITTITATMSLDEAQSALGRMVRAQQEAAP